MKTNYKPIAMRCTQEQFDSIKDLIPLSINEVYNLETYPYLSILNKCVTNGNKGYYKEKKLEIIEEFNGKYFLECCGVDVLEDVSEEKIWNSDQIQWRAYDTGDWINASGSVQFRLKPKPNLDPDIEALQRKAKELGINLTILIE